MNTSKPGLEATTWNPKRKSPIVQRSISWHRVHMHRGWRSDEILISFKISPIVVAIRLRMSAGAYRHTVFIEFRTYRQFRSTSWPNKRAVMVKKLSLVYRRAVLVGLLLWIWWSTAPARVFFWWTLRTQHMIFWFPMSSKSKNVPNRSKFAKQFLFYRVARLRFRCLGCLVILQVVGLGCWRKRRNWRIL